MKINKWAICCPGHSLSRYETKRKIFKFSPDYLIAVNGAILANLRFNYWTMLDIDVFETVIKQIHFSFLTPNTTKLWIPERWIDDIPAYHSNIHRTFTRFTKETYSSYSREALSQSMPFGRHLDWRQCTLFTAIALAVRKEADVIHIYGADMKGQGYFKEGLETQRIRHQAKRWQEELIRLNGLIRECHKYGIKLFRR